MTLRRRATSAEKEPLIDTVRPSSTGTWTAENDAYNDGTEDENAPLLQGNQQNQNQNQQQQNQNQQSFFELLWNYLTEFFYNVRRSLSTQPQLGPAATLPPQAAKLKSIACAPFDPEDPENLEYLRRLWKICFTAEFSLESKLWTKIGFQSDNPLRDIRGTGAFGLRNLLFMAETHPEKFRRLAHLTEKDSEQKDSYPFVVGAFNITMMLYELLGWGWKSAGVSTAKNRTAFNKLSSILFENSLSLPSSIETFNHLFCTAVLLLDTTWAEMGASYMDFPKVMAGTQTKFESVVIKFNTIEDVISWNKEH